MRPWHGEEALERTVNRQELMDGGGEGETLRSGVWLPACLWASEMLARWTRSARPINFLVNHAGHLVMRARAGLRRNS